MEVSKLVSKQWKFSRILCYLLEYIFDQGYEVSFGDAWRSTDKLSVPGIDVKFSYQELLFYNGKTKVKYGKHNDRLAVDLLIYKNGKELTDEEYRFIGEKWESMGGRWGGRFGVKKEEYNSKIGWDRGHFELP